MASQQRTVLHLMDRGHRALYSPDPTTALASPSPHATCQAQSASHPGPLNAPVRREVLHTDHGVQRAAMGQDEGEAKHHYPLLHRAVSALKALRKYILRWWHRRQQQRAHWGQLPRLIHNGSGAGWWLSTNRRQLQHPPYVCMWPRVRTQKPGAQPLACQAVTYLLWHAPLIWA